jgi:hypothetical protein
MPANMTKEHAWPQWLGKGAQVEPTQTTHSIGFGHTADDAMTGRRIGSSPRQALC